MSKPTFRELSESRQNNLDFLRFFFASVVVFTHSYCILANMNPEPIYRFTHRQMAAATIAVDFFFVISGFLVTTSWARSKGVWDYAKKRIQRIYPAFVVCVLLTILVSGFLSDVSAHAYWHDRRTITFIYRELLFRDVTLYRTFPHSHTPGLPLGSLATLPFELKCYCIIPVIGLLGLLRRRAAVLGLFGAALCFHNLFMLPGFGFCSTYLPRLVTYFLAGATLYLYRERVLYDSRWLAVALAVLAGAMFWGLSIALPIAGTYVVFYIAYSKRVRLQNWGANGDISYGIFLYGYLVQQIIACRTHYAISPTMLTLTSLPVTYVLAFGSWHLVEKRFLKRTKRSQVRPELAPAIAGVAVHVTAPAWQTLPENARNAAAGRANGAGAYGIGAGAEQKTDSAYARRDSEP